MGGKSKDIKRVFKVFQLVDYEKEEKYLSEMHATGWRFVDTNGYKYTFERCEPENVVYRIYCSNLKEDRENLTTLFRDYGWEYLLSVQSHSYFRRPAEGLSAEEQDLFSDTETRMGIVRRMIFAKVGLLVFLLILIIVPNILRFTGIVRKGSEGKWGVTMLITYSLLLLIYICYISHAIRGYYRLKKKYQSTQ